MSSFIRKMQRQVMPSNAVHIDKKGRAYANPPRKVFFNGRGDRLGVKNPEDKALLARLAREAKHRRAA